MKINKTVLITSIICCLLCITAASAADITASERGIVDFSDDFDMTGLAEEKSFDSYIFNNGEYDKFFSYKVLDAEDNIQCFGQTTADDAGTIGFSFRIKGKTGEYKLIVSNIKLVQKTYTIDYVNNIYVDFNDVKLLSDETEMDSFMNDNGEYLGLDKPAYTRLSDEEKRKVLQYFIALPNITSTEDMVLAVENAKVTDRLFLNASKADTVIAYIGETYKTEDKIFNTPIAKVFAEELKEDKKPAAVSVLMGKELTDENIRAFEFEVLKSKISQIVYFVDMEDIILEENNIWGFDERDISNFGESSTNDVERAMLTGIETASDIDEYRELLGKVIAENPASRPSGGSGSGTGGSKSTSAIVGTGKIVETYKVQGADLFPDVPTEEQQPEQSGKVQFLDLGGYEWAENAIEGLINNFIVNGITNTEFAPGDSITREQFVKMITAGLRLTGAEAEVTMSDVSENAWFYAAVGAAQRANIITGDDNGNFGVGQSITRQDAAVMIWRAASFAGVNIVKKSDISFLDDSAISSYARSGVKKLANAGIINGMGDGSFAPTNNLTRAEAAKLLYEFFSTANMLKW